MPDGFTTKQVGDIAEAAVLLAARERGYEVLVPSGDRLPYDLVFDLGGKLIKIQVKSAWYDARSGNWCCDNRRQKTNRKRCLTARYTPDDFDFAIIFLPAIRVFYVMPVDVFISYAGGMQFVEKQRRQRKPRSAPYREAWRLIEAAAGLSPEEALALAASNGVGSA